MKKLLLALLALMAMLTLSACQDSEECEECEKCTVCEECTACPTCVENPQLSFYEEMVFPGSGYTPGYTYYLSGTLNDDGEVTDIRFNMVSVYGSSKRSSEYDMNVAKVQVGGVDGHHSLEIFIGGSTTNISQVYNVISGDFTDGTETLKSLGFEVYYPGQVIPNTEEIYGLLEKALDITIDDNTTIVSVLDAFGLVSESVIQNDFVVVELEGYAGGGNYDHQLTSLETYIIAEALTLEEVYELVSTNNQGYDERDAVAGATIMFDKKIIAIAAQAAGIEISTDPVVLGTIMDGTNTVIGLRVYGMHEMTVSVTIDSSGHIISLDVVSHTETEGLGKAVIEGDYITSIIAGQDDLAGVDAVAGSTITSSALKQAVEVALTEYAK